MEEFIPAFVSLYLASGLCTALIWGMERGRYGGRQNGETGIEFIGKWIFTGVIWPYHFCRSGLNFWRDSLRPWLTEPK